MILILFLSSCNSKRTNIIVSGNYGGIDSQNELISCNLQINQISETNYLESNGKNVIKDSINGKYYSIVFTINYQGSETKQIEFINFKDAYNGAKGTPISYVDDNNYWLTPCTTNNNKIMNSTNCYYIVELNFKNIELFTYLYCMEDF